MSQGFIIFLTIGALFAYFTLGFVGEIQDADDDLLTDKKIVQNEDMTYHQQDVIGQTILIFGDQSYQKKLSVWKRSPLHKEFMNYFPDFILMKAFIEDRIIGKDFQEKLTEKLTEIEDAYLAGEISLMQAKIKLNAI